MLGRRAEESAAEGMNPEHYAGVDVEVDVPHPDLHASGTRALGSGRAGSNGGKRRNDDPVFHSSPPMRV